MARGGDGRRRGGGEGRGGGTERRRRNKAEITLSRVNNQFSKELKWKVTKAKIYWNLLDIALGCKFSEDLSKTTKCR